MKLKRNGKVVETKVSKKEFKNKQTKRRAKKIAEHAKEQRKEQEILNDMVEEFRSVCGDTMADAVKENFIRS